MKRLLLAAFMISTPAAAQNSDGWASPTAEWETPSQKQGRISAERYDEYQTRRSQGQDWAPLGGYQDETQRVPYGTVDPYAQPDTDAYGNPTPSYQ